jgi:hypothetical protein
MKPPKQRTTPYQTLKTYTNHLQKWQKHLARARDAQTR